MDKWVLAAFLYVAILIGGFTVYEDLRENDKQVAAAEMHQSSESHSEKNEDQHGHESSSHEENSSEVHTYVQAEKGDIKIFLKDKSGNPVHDLEVNHEKLLHFIVVDEQLQKYYHLHPEQTGNGQFRIKTSLPDGFYQAFIDIKPKNKSYHVTPVPFVVGNPSISDQNEGLTPDSELTQQVDGETVTLSMSSFHTNEPVTLSFGLDQSGLRPYLGALGHVVILDDAAQQYLHVHPTDEKKPVFETRFQKPGIYKVWAEFNQNGKVRAFPFVVEIKGEKLQ